MTGPSMTTTPSATGSPLPGRSSSASIRSMTSSLAVGRPAHAGHDGVAVGEVATARPPGRMVTRTADLPSHLNVFCVYRRMRTLMRYTGSGARERNAAYGRVVVGARPGAGAQRHEPFAWLLRDGSASGQGSHSDRMLPVLRAIRRIPHPCVAHIRAVRGVDGPS